MNWARTNGVRTHIKAVQDTGCTQGHSANKWLALVVQDDLLAGTAGEGLHLGRLGDDVHRLGVTHAIASESP